MGEIEGKQELYSSDADNFPADEIDLSGLQERLNNLGFNVGNSAGQPGSSKPSDNLRQVENLRNWLDPILQKLASMRKNGEIKLNTSRSDFRKRFKVDPNAQLDRFRITWTQEGVKLFNDYIDRAKNYLEKHRTLSREDFSRFFWWSWSVLAVRERFFNGLSWITGKYWQKNVWNCYLVASLRSLVQSPLYEHFVCTSVSYDKEKKQFTVKIPLWCTRAKSYVITEKMLKPQKNRFYNPNKATPPQTVPLQQVKWDFQKKEFVPLTNKNGTPILFRRNRSVLYPINAPKWLQALEAAYLLAARMGNDWVFDRLKLESGLWSDALETLLWMNNTDKWNILYFEKDDHKIRNIFNQFHPLTHYVILGSKRLKDGDRFSYKVQWTNIKLYRNHAYTIIDTDPDKKTVTLVEPSEFTKPITLTYDQAVNNFHNLKYCKADYRNGFT